jgi:hypothetical protein
MAKPPPAKNKRAPVKYTGAHPYVLCIR